jgi:hypothetical protein
MVNPEAKISEFIRYKVIHMNLEVYGQEAAAIMSNFLYQLHEK